jgi:multicomponent Na+:H+ antiporter subunit G
VVRDGVAIGLAVCGLLFSLSGVVGILRMPDLYTRVQCSSKTITMGALPVLVALVVSEGPLSTYGSRALIVALLLLVANPMASHALVRAAYKAGVPMWKGAAYDQVAPRRAALSDDQPEDRRAVGD